MSDDDACLGELAAWCAHADHVLIVERVPGWPALTSTRPRAECVALDPRFAAPPKPRAGWFSAWLVTIDADVVTYAIARCAALVVGGDA